MPKIFELEHVGEIVGADVAERRRRREMRVDDVVFEGVALKKRIDKGRKTFEQLLKVLFVPRNAFKGRNESRERMSND